MSTCDMESFTSKRVDVVDIAKDGRAINDCHHKNVKQLQILVVVVATCERKSSYIYIYFFKKAALIAIVALFMYMSKPSFLNGMFLALFSYNDSSINNKAKLQITPSTCFFYPFNF